MDDIERGQEREQQDRALCLAIALSHPQRDYVGEICTGCDYATQTNRGKLDAHCATRNDLPPIYGPGHPLQHLPADSGAACAQWSQA